MRNRVTEFTIIFIALAALFAVAAIAYSLGWHRGYDAALKDRALVARATSGLQAATYRAEPVTVTVPVRVEYEVVAHPKATAAIPPPAVSPKPGAAEPPSAAPGAWRTAVASWYGPTGNPTANGTPYDSQTWCVAHRSLPFGTRVEIAYNGRRIVAPVLDRGPYVDGRELDLSEAVAKALGFHGVRTVRWRVL